jgi:hypothetical protein
MIQKYRYTIKGTGYEKDKKEVFCVIRFLHDDALSWSGI